MKIFLFGFLTFFPYINKQSNNHYSDRAGEISTWKLTRECLRAADFVIKPAVSRISWANFKKYKEIIHRAKIIAGGTLPQLWKLYEEKNCPW